MVISGSDKENILKLALQRPNLLLCLVHRDTLPEKAVGCQTICDHIAQIGYLHHVHLNKQGLMELNVNTV